MHVTQILDKAKGKKLKGKMEKIKYDMQNDLFLTS